MEEGQKISVSAQDLIAVLAHSGSLKRAREFAKENNFSKKEIDQINETPPETNISNSLKEAVTTVLNTSKMIRFENGDQCLLVYPAEGTEIILEYVHKGHYEFLNYNHSKDLNEVICDFYGLDLKLQEDPVKINIELSNNLYDQIHNMDSANLNEMIDDEKIDGEIRQFLRDFKRNNQQVSKIVFKKRKNEKNYMQEDLVMLFVPGKDYIWHIKYEESVNNQIFLMSNSVSHYFNVLHKVLGDILQDNQSQRKKTSSQPKQEVEKFSFKRGFPFFWKGNLALLVAILFFYINKSSWSEEGGPVVLLFALAWEAVIILLSFFACFKEREESSPVKKARPA